MPYYGKYRGIVTENDDPQKQGRLKVKIPKLFGDEELEWAYPCIQFASSGFGMCFIPKIDDLVWVEFECGEVSCPVWTGMWWIKDGLPKEYTLDKQLIKTLSGHTMEFSGKENEVYYRISDTSGQKIEVDSTNQKIVIKDVSGQNITIDTKNQIIQLANTSGEKGITDVTDKTIEADQEAFGGTYDGFMGTASEMGESMTSGVTDFISSNGSALVSSLTGELTSLYDGFIAEGQALAEEKLGNAISSVTSLYEDIGGNFEMFYNESLLPKVTSGEWIDPAYLELVMQGVEGIKTDIEGVKDSIIQSITSAQETLNTFINENLNLQLSNFTSTYGALPISSCQNLLDQVTSDFTSNIQMQGRIQSDYVQMASADAKVDKPIYAVTAQNIVINSKDQYTEISHADGMKIKIDSIAKEISIIDSFGHKIAMTSNSIDLKCNGGYINLG